MSRAIALRQAKANLARKGVRPVSRADLVDIVRRAIRRRWFT